eukprot:Rhum_TRINITY_DN14614_c20_g1::Rhum_TRINITY_DN14614_c20_g1_i1::g.104443::m.104443
MLQQRVLCVEDKKILVLGENLLQLRLQLALVDGKVEDTLRELLHSHLVLVVPPQEVLLVQLRELLDVERLRLLRVQLRLEGRVVLRQLVQQGRSDGQVVAARQVLDLVGVAEGRAHDDGLVAELLVVVVDLRHALDTRVVQAREVLRRLRRLVPVEDASHERRDQRHARLRARHRLREGEEQRQVAVDALGLELPAGLDALPRGRELDEHAVLRHAGLLVQRDDLARLGDAAVLVEGQAGVHLRRHTLRHVLQDLQAEVDGQLRRRLVKHLSLRLAVLAAVRHGVRRQRLVLLLARGGEQQRRVRGGVLRLVLRDELEVRGVRDNGRVLLEESEDVARGALRRRDARAVSGPGHCFRFGGCSGNPMKYRYCS